jgi:uncharacterized membrane protein
MSYSSQTSPFFNTPIRWSLRVLAWLAFVVAAFLAWHSVGGTSVAGCGVGDANSCDIVLSSSWAKWLGIPVAVLGLACYATLAGLSVVLGTENPQASRWINTAFVMFAILAAGASLWFIGVQIFAIGHYCRFCIFVDLCGLAIGGIAIWSAVQWYLASAPIRSSHSSAASLTALKSAIPARGAVRMVPTTSARNVPVVAPRSVPAAAVTSVPMSPSLSIAVGAATAMLVLLMAGQIILPSKTYTSQDARLEESMTLAGAKASGLNDSGDPSSSGSHVAMRLPTDPIDGEADRPSGRGADEAAANEDALFPPESDSTDNSSTADAQSDADLPNNGDNDPSRPINSSQQRIVEFLNGSLKLDVYKHALIGSPEAPHVMIEMVSYDCPHCREMHRTIAHGLSRYGSQLAIIVMPIPLEMRCNRLITDPKASHQGACSTARMALGVAAIRPNSFQRFHDWLMADKEKPPRVDKIIAQAYGMVDRARLSSLSNGPDLNRQIKEYVELYARLANQAGGNGKFGLPVQILGNHIMAGKAEKESDVFDAWEKHLGVTSQ